METLKKKQAIFVLERGYILIGTIIRNTKTRYIIDDCAIIRQWGTEFGLGQIAISGTTERTKLDKQPKTEVFKSKIIQKIDCYAEILV